MKTKILITGGAGFLGMTWSKYALQDYEVHVTVNKHAKVIPGVTAHAIDLTNKSAVDQLLNELKPDLVINTAGYTNVDHCEEHPDLAHKFNVTITENLAIATKAINCRFVHISTDHLVDGKQKVYKETDPVAPINVYAQSKREGEIVCLAKNPDALIIRTNFFGKSEATKLSFTDWIYNELFHNRSISMYTDVYFASIYAPDLVRYVHAALEKGATGILNIAGKERISKYDFGIRFARLYGLDEKLINPISIDDMKIKVKRPKELCLDITKFKQLTNIEVDSLDESFTHLKNELGGTMIHYGQHQVDEDDIAAVVDVLKNRPLTQGPKVEEFEKHIANLVGAKYCVAVANWTAGIHMTCLAAGLDSSNVLVTSPMTFCASSNGALFCNSTPYFADIDPATLNISPAKVEEACKRLGNVKAIMPVHFGGLPADMEAIHKIAKKYNAIVIEDAAHAIGARYADGSMVGNCKYADMVGFSFHPVKNIACGEGGAITTNNEELYRKLLRLRSHGINKMNDPLISAEAFTNGKPNQWYNEMQDLGYNFRITDIQCALGLSQMQKLEKFMKRRLEIANIYDEAFKSLKNAKVAQPGMHTYSGNHLYLLRVDYEKLGKTRYQVIDELRSHNIQGHVHYLPVPMHPYYMKNVPTPVENYSEALKYYRQALTIPLYPAMTNDQVQFVIKNIKEFIG